MQKFFRTLSEVRSNCGAVKAVGTSLRGGLQRAEACWRHAYKARRSLELVVTGSCKHRASSNALRCVRLVMTQGGAWLQSDIIRLGRTGQSDGSTGMLVKVEDGGDFGDDDIGA